MKEKKEGKEGSQSISQKDEGKFNKKVKENHPEVPTPVIECVPYSQGQPPRAEDLLIRDGSMNDERERGHK